ncbi:MAG: hypothetical protein PVH65_16620 [Chloroflexota bacterium]
MAVAPLPGPGRWHILQPSRARAGDQRPPGAKRTTDAATTRTPTMNDIARRMQRAAERLLENESLTADLNDEAARLLLAWGVAWTHMIVESTAGLDEGEARLLNRPRLKATRRMLRTVNRWAGSRGAMDAAADRVLLGKIYDRAVAAATTSGAVDEQARQRFLARAAALQGEPAALVGALRRETEIAVGLKQEPRDEADA